MKNLMRIMLFMATVFFNSVVANGGLDEHIEPSGQEVSIPSQLGDIKLYKDDDGFHVIKGDKIYDVQNIIVNNKQSEEFDTQKNVNGKLKKITAIVVTIFFCAILYNYRCEVVGFCQNFWDLLTQQIKYQERQNRKKRVYKEVRNGIETLQDVINDGIETLRHNV